MNFKTVLSLSLLTLPFLLFSPVTVFAQSSSFVGGGQISMALCSDSTVKIWGDNTSYCTDTNHIVHSAVPVPVAGLSGVVEIACGTQHSVALKADGTVWTWGINFFGELGDGTTYFKLNPTVVPGLSGIRKISSGSYHSFAIENDSTVWSWGDNEYGQLGIDSIGATGFFSNCTCKPSAIKVVGLGSGILAVAGGWNHSLALKSDGTVWSWGDDSKGQLGTGGGVTNPLPTLVNGVSGITAVSCGRNHSIALKNDGTVWGWGDAQPGAIGDPIDTMSACVCHPFPLQIAGLSGIIAVSAGQDFTLALKNDGTVWALGNNQYGQLGDGTATLFSDVPVQVSGLTGIIAISGGYGHSLALKNDGTMWAWGWNDVGQLGNGTVSTGTCSCERTPVLVNSPCPIFVAGINEQEAGIDLAIFPNPASGQLFIQTNEKIKTIICVNTLGQSFNLERENNMLNISSLSAGMYFLNVQFDKDRTVVKRFIKE